ncbi:F-box/kelch-repeat protein At3g23880 [Quercus suber]|uniref:F-box/kelch-repeat protein n=1 Tax=Quercus suber TaxID=58331 RepID=A0AAW0L4U7_QUESU|nr:F-box/kelch-repeat protein At3g23880-like [Quercus suber]XP_023915145.1 F-box/kelch-repeat protein At3g23880-like [Quercus suber]POF07298.1 f-box/kelch-repeat protein [Quercus suber]POF07306.1 f-box/kelch-repeat protein [Quercus suber]
MSRSRRCSLSLRSNDSKWRWGRRSRRCSLSLSSDDSDSRRCRLKSLPEELVEEILAWLPVKSLVRFKCVKKSWSSLFQTPTFIAKHLRYNQSKTKNHPNPTLLVHILGLRSLVSKYLLQSHHHDEANDHRSVYHDHLLQYHHDVGSVSDEWLVLEEEGRLPFVDYFQGENMMSGLFTDGLLCTNMFACINGIICIGGLFSCFPSFQGFVLWNPAIREGKTVAYPITKTPDFVQAKESFSFFAFGYDQISNDYKVVRVERYTMKSASTSYYNSFYVYSLRADSWTQIFSTPFHHSNVSVDTRHDEIYFNGVHHWFGYPNEELMERYSSHIIISFDMSHEVFQIIRFPEFSTIGSERLAVFNDCLACILYGVTECIDIWVMREYGIEDSWTKQLVVNPPVPIACPVRFFGNGEFLLFDKNWAMVLYNIGSQEIRILQCTGYPNTSLPIELIDYVESLVSFTGGNVF